MRLSEDQLKAMGYAIEGSKAVRLSPSPKSGDTAVRSKNPKRQDVHESRPQRQLYQLLTHSPTLGHLPWQWEYQNPVPGRKFTLDIALELNRPDGAPPFKGGLECDGWSYHGRYLNGFKRDREKDRQLALCGWRVLRITAGEILKSSGPLLEDVERWLDIETPGWRIWSGAAP